jgi:hypothetical protein
LLAEASKNVVFVMGAGLSVPAGIPTWDGLNEILKKAAVDVLQGDARLTPDEIAERIAAIDAIENPWILGDELAAIIPGPEYIRLVKEQLSATKIPRRMNTFGASIHLGLSLLTSTILRAEL